MVSYIMYNQKLNDVFYLYRSNGNKRALDWTSENKMCSLRADLVHQNECLQS